MKISVITCVLNGEKYINDCLSSIACQQFRNFELIVIDGYSTDNSIKIIKKYSSSLPIRLFQQKPAGISAAMNYGSRKAQGDFLIHLHADDLFHDKNVLRDVNLFLEKNEKLDWIYGKINSIEEEGKPIGIFPTKKLFQINFYHLLKYINYIPHQSVFIRKNVFEKYGYFDENLSSEMDTEFWLRIGKKTRWKFFDRIISNYRIHSSAQSSGVKNRETTRKNREFVQKRYTNLFEFTLCKLINRLIWKIYDRKNLR